MTITCILRTCNIEKKNQKFLRRKFPRLNLLNINYESYHWFTFFFHDVFYFVLNNTSFFFINQILSFLPANYHLIMILHVFNWNFIFKMGNLKRTNLSVVNRTTKIKITIDSHISNYICWQRFCTWPTTSRASEQAMRVSLINRQRVLLPRPIFRSLHL